MSLNNVATISLLLMKNQKVTDHLITDFRCLSQSEIGHPLVLFLDFWSLRMYLYIKASYDVRTQ